MPLCYLCKSTCAETIACTIWREIPSLLRRARSKLFKAAALQASPSSTICNATSQSSSPCVAPSVSAGVRLGSAAALRQDSISRRQRSTWVLYPQPKLSDPNLMVALSRPICLPVAF
jgi:hypothetical protein